MGLLVREIFFGPSLSVLNLVEVELPEQNFSIIPCNQEFGIFEEIGENIDDLKMVIVRFMDALKNL